MRNAKAPKSKEIDVEFAPAMYLYRFEKMPKTALAPDVTDALVGQFKIVADQLEFALKDGDNGLVEMAGYFEGDTYIPRMLRWMNIGRYGREYFGPTLMFVNDPIEETDYLEKYGIPMKDVLAQKRKKKIDV